MLLILIWLSILSAYVLSRIAEWRLHVRNYAKLKRAGAEELIPQLMRRYYLVPHVAVVLALGEQLAIGQPVWRELLMIGAAMAVGGFALRLWSIESLGNVWSMRCMALAGLRPTNKGPYRFLDNPEYLSRLIEGLGLCLMLGARITPVLFVLVMMALNRRIAAVERRQLLEVACARP